MFVELLRCLAGLFVCKLGVVSFVSQLVSLIIGSIYCWLVGSVVRSFCLSVVH